MQTHKFREIKNYPPKKYHEQKLPLLQPSHFQRKIKNRMQAMKRRRKQSQIQQAIQIQMMCQQWLRAVRSLLRVTTKKNLHPLQQPHRRHSLTIFSIPTRLKLK